MSEGQRGALFERMKTERGFTILIRHADKMSKSSDRTTGTTTTIVKDDCRKFGERLNDHGVEQAEILHSVFDYLRARFNVRIDNVISSDSCRALETARIAFGKELVRKANDQDLRTDNEKMSLHERVRMNIGATNRVLVSHSGEISTALNVTKIPERQLGCAEAVVLEFKAGGTDPKCLARILPEEWLESDFRGASENYYKNVECPGGAISARGGN